jgi:hypothetical protein
MLPALSDAELQRRYEAQQAAKRPVVAAVVEPTAPRRKRASRDRGPTEHELQCAFFARVNDPAEQAKRPALALVHAVPNGGKRSWSVAVKLKAEGVKPGVPDIHAPLARGGYFGLWIEMKRPGETTTPAQGDWLWTLAKEGYKTALHTTAEGAWAELCAYLDSPRTDVLAPLTSQE